MPGSFPIGSASPILDGMPARRALLVVVVAAILSAPLPSTASPSIEAQVFAKINAARSSRLVIHSGLLSVARMHSMSMARRDSMDHDGADARINNAAPDPPESNGAPDDGWPPARWCENVTYAMDVPEAEAAGRIYDAWARSGAHNRCMKDASRNVGAVGIHYDGQRWWATFIANEDRTPPGGGAAQAPPPANPPSRRAQAAPAAEPTRAQGPSTIAGAPVARTETNTTASDGPVAPADPMVPSANGIDAVMRTDPEPEASEPAVRRNAAGAEVERRVAAGRPDASSPSHARLALLGYEAREIGVLFVILLLGSLYVCRRPRAVKAAPRAVPMARPRTTTRGERPRERHADFASISS